MVNKIWNSILMILALGLIVGIVYNEISYDRFSKYDYYLHSTQDDDVVVGILENQFNIKDNVVSLSKGQNSYLIEKKSVPEKLHLLWFNYIDDKFYEFNGNLPYEIIRQKMKDYNDISIKIGKKNSFQFIVNEDYILNLKAKEVSKPWFNENYDREQIVFFARDKKKIIPYLNLESDSEFSEFSSYPVTFYNFSHLSNDYANLLVNGRLFYKYEPLEKSLNRYEPLETSLIEQIDLSLIKKNKAKKGSEEYFNKTILKLRINFDPDQLYEILKSNPIDKFDLKIIVDKNDSLKSIYFMDQNKMIKLNTDTKYEQESKIDTAKIK
ncbi:DUF2931 family protein [Chryseobacterium luquanense]|uniref:DUF2931 family protein n=1 Tax=Chryseobacterium luquanense TaxID=2983766 RepID=A0ABT3Y2B4_9FLAO|nr:DUF2931 family protein [Chryseobacterium luquanense]MCX8532285.1 DUF2931 family protein [Chryseobacterium luquanense]